MNDRTLGECIAYLEGCADAHREDTLPMLAFALIAYVAGLALGAWAF